MTQALVITEDMRTPHEEYRKMIDGVRNSITFKLIDDRAKEANLVAMKQIHDPKKNSTVVLGEFEDIQNKKPKTYEFIDGTITVHPYEKKKLEFFKLHPANRNSPFNHLAEKGMTVWYEVDTSNEKLKEFRVANFKNLAADILASMNQRELGTFLAHHGLIVSKDASVVQMKALAREKIKDDFLFTYANKKTVHQNLYVTIKQSHDAAELQYTDFVWYYKDQELCEVSQDGFADEELVKFIEKYYVNDAAKLPTVENAALHNACKLVKDLVDNVLKVEVETNNDFSPSNPPKKADKTDK
jgi:hypothetical protein